MKIRKALNRMVRYILSSEPVVPTHPIRQLYLSTFGRAPTKRELRIGTRRMLSERTWLKSLIEEHLLSEEFIDRKVPHLLAQRSRDYSEAKKIFFVHIPKASGTSLRTELVRESGLPGLDFYGSSEIEAVGLDSPLFLSSWPLVTGHMNIHTGPHETHAVVTSVREPRSRLLSLFRENTRAKYSVDPYWARNNGRLKQMSKRYMAHKRERRFGEWLNGTVQHHLSYFVDPTHPAILRGEDIGFVRSLGRRQLLNFVDRSVRELDDYALADFAAQAVQLIDVAEWSDSNGLLACLDHLFPHSAPHSHPPRKNSSDAFPTPARVSLTQSDCDRLDIIAERDTVFLEALTRAQVLPAARVRPTEAFLDTAKRLKFTLP